MRLISVAVATALSAGCADAFTSRVDVVARADDYELGVERLAIILAKGEGFVLNRQVVEGVAGVWIDYTLFARSIVFGDSLLDSATVVAAKWADVQQEIATSYHEMLVRDLLALDSAQVDSVYLAGEYRLIKRVLFEVAFNASPDVRTAKRAVAIDLYNRLRNNMSWAEASQWTEEVDVKDREGSMGVIGRGEHVAALENAAYALEPGEFSDVVATGRGYEILYRPPLEEVYAEFRAGVKDRVEQDFEADYLTALPERWDIEVRSSALPAIREVASDPARAKRSRTVVGTYREGGRFRVSDVARWMQGMAIPIRQQLATAPDSQITLMVRTLIRNQVLLTEAKDAGVAISAAAVDGLRDQLARELALLGAVMGLHRDTLALLARQPEAERRGAVRVKVIGYLLALSQNERRMQLVPPFLADELRSRFEWKLVPAGVERVLTRAREIRAAIESTRPPAPTQPATPPDSGAESDAS